MQIDKGTLVTGTELAVVLGLSVRRIQQLAQDGTFAKVGRGRYALAGCVQAYCSTLTHDVTDEAQERALAELKIKQAKAVIAGLEAAELQGKMHRSEDVASMTSDLVFTMRSMLNALPGRLAMDAAGAQTAAEASAAISREVHALMRELANYEYDPSRYEACVRERRKWEAEQAEQEEVCEA